MRTVSGVELAERVTRERPRVPVLFLGAGAPELSHPALPKGCEPEELAAAVLRMCGTGPRAALAGADDFRNRIADNKAV